MRVRIFLVLWASSAAASAGPIDEARDRMRNGSVAEANAAIDALVAADSADAVAALQQGIRSVLKRQEQEEAARTRKWDELIPLVKALGKTGARTIRLRREGKEGTAAWKALQKESERLKASMDKVMAEARAAGAKVWASEATVHAALLSFRRFRADDAVAAIEQLATGKDHRVAVACTEALVHIGAARSVPVLAGLARVGSTPQVALAARGLRLNEGGPTPELKRLLSDRTRQVRYGAYEAVACGPPAVAIPLLIAAREAAQEDAPRIDLYLSRLSGATLATSTEWSEWWERNGDAIRGGTFRRPGGTAIPPDGHTHDVLSGTRSLLLVAGCGPLHAENGMDTSVLAAVREHVKQVVASVPDGTTFGILMLGREASVSLTSDLASDVSRRRAQTWIEETPPPPQHALDEAFMQLLQMRPEDIDADTLLLASASVDDVPVDLRDRLLVLLDEWNLGAGLAIHCVGVGERYDESLLASIALRTGGSFTAGATRLYGKIPAPGADRWTAGRVRVEAYRALRAQHGTREALTALVSIGEEAYPLLPMIAQCLSEDRPRAVRVAALEALGAMGPWALEAVPRIQELADTSPLVSEEAHAALKRVCEE